MGRFLFSAAFIICSISVFSQPNYHYADTDYKGLSIQTNPIITSMGGIGSVSSSYHKSLGLYQNPALLVKNDEHYGGEISYLNPKFKSDNSYMYTLGGFYSINKKHKLGIQYKAFQWNDKIYITNYNNPENSSAHFINMDKADFYLKAVHNICFSDRFSFGYALQYIHSNFYNFFKLDNKQNNFAISIGINYENEFSSNENVSWKYNTGLCIDDFGPKSYFKIDNYETRNTFYDNTMTIVDKKWNLFQPTLIRLGLHLGPEFNISNKTKLEISMAYQGEKYLIPSNPSSKDSDISPFRALHQSFYDAPGGFDEEIQEITNKIGAEILLHNDNFNFAIRAGKQFQYIEKGNYDYSTLGLGVGIKGLSLDLIKTFPPEEESHYYPWGIMLGFQAKL